MYIEQLTLRGIGPFVKEVTINFTNLDNLCALTGRNGIGKTFVLESIPGALYALYPLRMVGQTETIYDMIQPNMDCLLELIFRVGVRRYRIVRNLRKIITFKGNEIKAGKQEHNAFIYEETDGDWGEPIAEGSNVVKQYVEDNICQQRIFLSSIFNSQKSAGDLVGCTADQRKAIFAQLIGLGFIQDKSDVFIQRSKDMQKIIDRLKTQIEANKTLIIDTIESDAIIRILENEYKELNDTITLLNTARDTAIVEWERSKNRRNEYGKKRVELIEKENECGKLSDKIVTLKTRQGQIEDLKKKKILLEKWEKYTAVLSARFTKITDLNNQIMQKEMSIDVVNTRIETEKGRLKVEEKSVRESSAEKFKLKELESEFDIFKRHVDDSKILERLKCVADCEFVEKARIAEQWLTDHAKDEKLLEGKFEKVHKQIESNLIKANLIKMAIESGDYCKVELARIDELNKERAELKKEIEIQGTLKDKRFSASELSDEFQKATANVDALKKQELDKKIAEGEGAAEQIPEIQERIILLQGVINGLRKEVDSFKDDNVKSPEIYDEEIKLKQGKINLNRDKKARAKSEAERSCEKQFENNLLESRLKLFQKLQENYIKLARAFSRNGIQALIIDSERVSFLNISKQLFDILTNGEIQLSFDTQTVTKGGDRKEGFELYLIIEGEKRKLEQASMAQQDLGRIIMRATMGIYYSSRSPLESYFLDETTGSFDEIYRPQYLSFLKYLTQYFRQIIVISHQDTAKSIPCHIHVNSNRQIEIG